MNKSPFKIIHIEGLEKIFDPVRKKYVVLTPEEWVRQQIIVHLIHSLNYPASLLSIEKQIKVNQRNRRYDLVVYKDDNPWLIVECKAEQEPLNASVLSQLLAYNSSLKAKYLAISNGKEIHCYDLELKQWHTQLPNYISMDY